MLGREIKGRECSLRTLLGKVRLKRKTIHSLSLSALGLRRVSRKVHIKFRWENILLPLVTLGQVLGKLD